MRAHSSTNIIYPTLPSPGRYLSNESHPFLYTTIATITHTPHEIIGENTAPKKPYITGTVKIPCCNRKTFIWQQYLQFSSRAVVFLAVFPYVAVHHCTALYSERVYICEGSHTHTPKLPTLQSQSQVMSQTQSVSIRVLHV